MIEVIDAFKALFASLVARGRDGFGEGKSREKK